MRKAALQLIRLYQRWISPSLLPACRYTPTCSHYAADAIEFHGARGVLLALWRLARCHPFARGGFDPVPLPRDISGLTDIKSRRDDSLVAQDEVLGRRPIELHRVP